MNVAENRASPLCRQAPTDRSAKHPVHHADSQDSGSAFRLALFYRTWINAFDSAAYARHGDRYLTRLRTAVPASDCGKE